METDLADAQRRLEARLVKQTEEAVAREAEDRLGDFNEQVFASVVWAFAVADVRHLAFLTACHAHALTLDLSSQHPMVLSKLHQWQLWAALECTPADERQLLPPPLRQRCREAMETGANHASQLQRAVGYTLASLRPGFEEEVIELRTSYSLDLALQSLRVAVEVDGPSHFVQDARGAHWPNGPTLLKQRLLRAAGWRLVSVPFFEWNRLEGREAQRDYLQRKLDEVARTATACA